MEGASEELKYNTRKWEILKNVGLIFLVFNGLTFFISPMGANLVSVSREAYSPFMLVKLLFMVGWAGAAMFVWVDELCKVHADKKDAHITTLKK